MYVKKFINYFSNKKTLLRQNEYEHKLDYNLHLYTEENIGYAYTFSIKTHLGMFRLLKFNESNNFCVKDSIIYYWGEQLLKIKDLHMYNNKLLVSWVHNYRPEEILKIYPNMTKRELIEYNLFNNTKIKR